MRRKKSSDILHSVECSCVDCKTVATDITYITRLTCMSSFFICLVPRDKRDVHERRVKWRFFVGDYYYHKIFFRQEDRKKDTAHSSVTVSFVVLFLFSVQPQIYRLYNGILWIHACMLIYIMYVTYLSHGDSWRILNNQITTHISFYFRVLSHKIFGMD